MKTLPALRIPAALVTLGALLSACGGGTQGPTQIATGESLTITVVGTGSAPVNVAGPSGTVFDDVINGSKTLTGLSRAAYAITAGNVTGFSPASPRSADLTRGPQHVELIFNQVGTAALTVTLAGTTSAPVTILDGDAILLKSTVSERKTFTSLPKKSLTVVAGAVDGRGAPAPIKVDLSAGDSTANLAYGEPSIEEGRVHGQLYGWTGISNATLVAPAGNSWPSAPIGSDGNVSLTLPTPATGLSVSEIGNIFSGCSRNLSISDTTAKVRFAPSMYNVYTNGSSSAYGIVVERPTATRDSGKGSEYVHRMYADRPATVTGTAACGSSSLSLSFSLELKAGWNVFRETVTGVDSSGRPNALTLSTSPAVTSSVLVFTKAAAGFTASLDNPYINLKAGDSATVNLTIHTSNDFSGPISLSLTEGNSGLTVSPSTINIPAATTTAASTDSALMRAMNVSTRTVTTQLTIKADANATRGPRTTYLRATGGGVTRDLYLNVYISKPHFTTYVPSKVTVAPFTPGTLDISASSGDGFQDTVSYTLAGAPSGVSASPLTLDLRHGYAYGTLNINAQPGTTPGTYTVQLVGTGGGITDTRSFELFIPAPTVDAQLTPQPLYQGENTALSTTVTSRYGFQGNVTLSLEGLPSGVTLASSPTLEVLAGSSAAVNLNLSVSSDASTGVANVSLVATSGQTVTRTPITLSVRPQRYAVGNRSTSSITVDTAGHPWYLTRYSENTYEAALGTLDSDGSPVLIKLGAYDYYSSRLVTGMDGNVWFSVGNTLGKTNWDTRTVTTWTMPTTPSSLAVDAKGRAWMVAYHNGSTALHVYDTTTNQLTQVDASMAYSSSSSTLRTGRNGILSLIAIPNGSSTPQLMTIDTTTEAINRYSVPGYTNLQGAFATTNGRVWVIGSTASGTRLGLFSPASGTVTLYEVPSDYSYYGYENSLTLNSADRPCLIRYSYEDGKAACFNTGSLSWATTIFTDVNYYNTQAVAPSPAGGWWYGWYRNSMGYLTYVKP